MGTTGYVEIASYFIVLAALAPPLGRFIARVLSGERHPLLPSLGWLERRIYRLAGVNPQATMDWRQYAVALLAFNALGGAALFALQLAQGVLPLNPQRLPGVPPWLALNTAVSFSTNTNWQAYSGEATMSYLTQMLGLGVQNFLSAATGMAVVAALARGLRGSAAADLGNFWVDLTRSVVYVLLPLSLLIAIALLSQGVVQSLSPYVAATTIDGGAVQTIPLGPAASQVAIKQLGSNGGGFFGVNSAHPFENPTPISNFIEMLAVLLIPTALPLTFGRLVGRVRHGSTLLAAMALLFAGALVVALAAESVTNPVLSQLPFSEGKEVRFGLGASVLWSVASTATSNGSVNAMLDSLSPLAGGMTLLNILLGEVAFGGVGSGVYGMILFVILAVFIAGLMVGRTPEYLGKKVEAPEIRLAVIGVLAPSVVILTFAAIACLTETGVASLTNKGPHGLTELLFAFASAAGNNGAAFAGLNANTPFYNGLLALAMLIGRYAVIVPVLAIAGGLAGKRATPPSAGTFATEGALFCGLLTATIVIVGALTFFPVLSLGPVMEHFLMTSGRAF